MNGKLMSVKKVKKMISNNKILLLAGDEKNLSQLPKGNWIAGTIPYFMGQSGGEKNFEQIFVNEMPSFISKMKIVEYDENNISSVYTDTYDNGVSFIIIPASSKIQMNFSLNASSFKDFASTILAGWISGVALEELGIKLPKVINGRNKLNFENKAIVMHIELPKNKIANIDIINLFETGEGESITFLETGFSAKTALINGKELDFYKFIKENNIDIQLPLVANYFGAMINTSFQLIDDKNEVVNFYAPVFKGVEYKLAKPINDYVTQFKEELVKYSQDDIFFSCNCILNYLYSDLKGKEIGGATGPVTFGEIAYQLINQTMVFVQFLDV